MPGSQQQAGPHARELGAALSQLPESERSSAALRKSSEAAQPSLSPRVPSARLQAVQSRATASRQFRLDANAASFEPPPHLRYATPEAVSRGIEALPDVGEPQQWAHRVAHDLTAFGAPDLALVAEFHGGVMPLLTTLTAMHVLARQPGRKFLAIESPHRDLIEYDLDFKSETVLRVLDNLDRGIDPMLGHPLDLVLLDEVERADVCNTLVTVAIGHRLGFELRGYDRFGKAGDDSDLRSMAYRETGMSPELALCMGTSDCPTLAIAGYLHADALQASLSHEGKIWVAGLLHALSPQDIDEARLQRIPPLLTPKQGRLVAKVPALDLHSFSGNSAGVSVSELLRYAQQAAASVA